MKKYVYFALIYLLYRVKWIDRNDGDSGYFLLKREWVWLLGFPILLIPVIIIAIYNSFIDIFSYDLIWIGKNKKKLSFKEKLIMADRLFD